MRSSARLFFLASLLLLGCTADGPSGETEGGSSGETSASSNPGGSSSAGSTGASATGPATSTAGSETSATGASGTSATAASTTTGAATGSSGDPTGGSISGSDSSTGDATSGDSSSGGEPAGPQWAQTTITYTGPSGVEVIDVEDCTFCDATLNGTTLLVRYQQAEGWTVWTLDIPVGASAGTMPITDDYSGAYVAINEQGQDLPPGYAGFYAATTGSGTLTLTDADISAGGVVAGTISASLSLGGVNAQLETEFYAEIPR